MARLFLSADETNVPIAGDGTEVFGHNGDESVKILDGYTGIVLDQNIEEIAFEGNQADYTFEQQGINLLVKNSSGDVIVTVPVQNDDDGTQLTFDDGTADAAFDGSEIVIGDDSVDPGDDDPSYTLTADADAVDEGETAIFSLVTTNVAEGEEVAYTISGDVDVADIAGDSLTGSVAVDADGNATISVDLLADVTTEGAETLIVTLADDETATANVTVNNTSTATEVVDIDTTAFPTETNFDADGDAYNFIDDAAASNYAVIDNFTDDDTISFVNADVNDYAFFNEGEDVTISYNYNDEGTMNVIELTGVVSSDALVYDLASFTDAVGFDAFG